MKQNLFFIFSVGFRCNSVDFLSDRKLRKFSGPFDYLFVNLESSFKIINNKFQDFLTDIVVIYKKPSHISLIHKKNTFNLNNHFQKLMKEDDIYYMSQEYNHCGLLINQNYIDNDKKELSNNLYKWDNICLFMHHAIQVEDVRNKLQTRCDRFMHVLNKYHSKNIALFFITKIINVINIFDYIQNIKRIKRINNINCWLIIIICSDNIGNCHYFNEENKTLIIIKNVDNYETQIKNNNGDNNYSFNEEYHIILKYFDFNLIEKDNI
jgi:hypothetical protein